MTGRRSFLKKTVASAIGAGFTLAAGGHRHNSSPKFVKNQDQAFYWDSVRKQFPLTKDRTYFNNGTSGPSPYPVLNAIQEKLTELSRSGEYAGQEVSRQPVAELLGVSENEICLTHNTTEGINIVASGLPLNRGDEVIMTSHEHAGNALPWLNQMKLRGIKIKVFTPGNTQNENMNRIDRLISVNTKVIAVPHITCTTGHVLPVKEIANLAHDKNIWVFFDGAHSAGSMRVNLKEMDCDFYASCGHKWLLGPSGTGFLYVSDRMIDVLQAEFIGAYSDTGWTISESEQRLEGYVDNAHRYYYGTQSAAISYGLKAAVNFMTEIGMEKVEQYSSSLTTYLRLQLAELGDKVEILTPEEPESRSTMIGFRIPSIDYEDFGKLASENKFRIRLVPESDLKSIRISTHIYNNKDEVDRFVSLVKSING